MQKVANVAEKHAGFIFTLISPLPPQIFGPAHLGAIISHLPTWSLHGRLVHPEDRGSRLPQNAGDFLPYYMVLHPEMMAIFAFTAVSLTC
jgi:hypothetical protein